MQKAVFAFYNESAEANFQKLKKPMYENLAKLLPLGFGTEKVDLIGYANEKNQTEMRDMLNTYAASIN